jgi:hypothetical protein
MENEIKQEECVELKNIMYKTMLLNGKALTESSSSDNLSHLNRFLENEQKNNDSEPWCKLNKTIKMHKIYDYVEEYKTSNNLDNEESILLLNFLKMSIDKKKLSKVKEVIYDKETGQIKQIPGLIYNKSTKHFTIKNIDKRVSTSKSLPPKKLHGTIKNKIALKTQNDSLEQSES